jgi:RNase H-fold protein (predicted Holliday junction resolvase)
MGGIKMKTDYLGIDYGTKRIGLASSDEEGKIAFPLSVLENDNKFIENLRHIIEEKEIKKVVIGESKNYKMQDNAIMTDILEHTIELDKTMPKYVCKVINQAKVKESAAMHNHGVSIAQSAEQCGVSLWELYNYIGKTTMNDTEVHSVSNMRKRIAFARSLFR